MPLSGDPVAAPDPHATHLPPRVSSFSPIARTAILFGVSLLLVVATRAPFSPAHLFSFDTVNFALALEDFDPSRNQPQPPGYPLFVAEAKLLYWLAGSPELTFTLLALLISGLSVGMLYLLGKELFSFGEGIVAAALLLVNPAFWYSGLTSPLRPHLALISISFAYCCWRAAKGNARFFYVASILLGLGGGFRMDLMAFLLPLWVWSLWQGGLKRLWFRGAALVVGLTLAWGIVVVMQSGGLQTMTRSFGQYIFSQTQDTSALLDAPAMSLRRNIGRAVIWTGLGSLPWIWTLPFGWRARRRIPHWSRHATFLAIWFLPAFLFHLLVHIADPDHALSTIPVLCLAGAFCLTAAERAIARAWSADIPDLGIAIFVALLGNVILFWGRFPVPQRQTVAQFRGLQSVSDAFLVGTYESSFNRVGWVEQMTDLAFDQIQTSIAGTNRPTLIVWARDGEPAWRKICYYFPEERVFALDERGSPAVPDSMARLWTGNRVLVTYSGPVPLRLPVPDQARIIWVVAPGYVGELSGLIPLQSAGPLYYSDLPPGSPSFRWGSFEFVPQ